MRLQLERLRRAPAEPSAASLVAALERVGELRELASGLGGLPALPAARMRALLVDAATRRAGDLAKMSEAQRLGTLVAFVTVTAERGLDEALERFSPTRSRSLGQGRASRRVPRGEPRAWQTVAPGWAGRAEQVFEWGRSVTERMLAALGARPGQTILELAAGAGDTGFLATAQVGPTGSVILTDFAPTMVDAARRHAASLGLDNVEFRVVDAERLGACRRSGWRIS